MKLEFLIFSMMFMILLLSIQAEEAKETEQKNMDAKNKLEWATFGGGCFWCTEAIFEAVDGVKSVVSGYSGGHVEKPTYKQVTTGTTGHAEVIRIEFDPSKTSYERLLRIFFDTHDPTTLNRQGADVGTQYRSVVYYHSKEQKETAERVKAELDKSGKYKSPIVTQIEDAKTFYEAEDYHQDYFRRNPDARYSQFVIKGKLEKFKQKEAPKKQQE